MERNGSTERLDAISAQLCKLVDETLGVALLEEVDYCRALIKNFADKYSSFTNKSKVILDQNSISGYLFESFETTVNLKAILGTFSKDSTSVKFHQELLNLNTNAIKYLNLEDEIKPLLEESSPIIFQKVNERLKITFSVLKKKNKLKVKSAECYQFFQVNDIIRDHIDGLKGVKICKLNLLSNLWRKSETINDNISILTDNKYEIVACRDKISLDVNFKDSESLIDDLRKEVNEFIQSIKAAIKEAFERLENEKHIQSEALQKNKGKYTPYQVLGASKTLGNAFKSSGQEWDNTQLALTDDWELELEINSLKFYILKGYFDFINHVDSKLKNPLDEKVNYLRDFTGELMNEFNPSNDHSPVEKIKTLKKRKIEFHQKLTSKLLPEIRNILINGNLPQVVDNFERNTAKQIELLSNSKYLIKDAVYDRPIERSEMYRISPYDLVSFDMQPKFMKAFPALKNAIIRQLQVLQTKFEEIPQIVEFSIDSALRYYEDNEDLNEALKIGFEGVKRAVNKIDDLSETREEFYNTEIDLLADKISRLIKDISEITDNESALQIKIRVTKAKAIEQSKAVRDKIFSNIRNFLPIVLNKVSTVYTFLLESSIKIRKQFEGELTKGFITSDVSDYLVETEEAVSRLPFVYQRLFKLEPLTTFDLYVERKEAYEKFEIAYSRWKTGKFAPVVIIGEKGSGKTSFINRVLSSKSISEKIIYHDLHKEYQDPQIAYNNVYESLNQILDLQKNKDPDNAKIIVVIDGLEKLFEARIDGFKILQKTVQLISKTNKQVFWVVGCHLYSYQYLDKSFHISEYFGYHIELEDLPAELLINIIERRHNISGFRLQFLPDVLKKSIIPSIKQVDKKDQIELRAIYFDRLQKIVSGNVTQAFLYWMRSAAEVTEDVIYIKQTDTKLDFVRSISLAKFEILKNILIHNGISSSKHSEIFRIPFEKSELQLGQLLDDGIIIKQSEFYIINPMIYKQIIDRMFNLNLLH